MLQDIVEENTEVSILTTYKGYKTGVKYERQKG